MELLKIYDEAFIKNIRKKLDKKTDWKDLGIEIDAHVAKVLPTLNKKKLPLADLKGHEIRFFTYWNKFVAGKKINSQELDYITRVLSSNVSHASILYSPNMNISDILQMSFKTHNEYCLKTGKFITCRLDDKLNFEFSQFNRKIITLPDGSEHSSGDFGPLNKNTFKDSVVEKIINIPTGNLILADFFRCEGNEFRDAVKPEKEDYSEENSINYPRGRVKEIMRSAEMNFIQVNMTSSPSVYQEGNKLVFGKDSTYDWETMKEKKHNKNYKGMIILDRWTLCAIDEKVFVELLMTKGASKQKAEKILAKVKKENGTLSLKVKPGKYKLSFCGDFEGFDSKIRKKGCKVNKKYKMSCLLEKV